MEGRVKRVLIAISGAVLAAGVEGVLARAGGFEVIAIMASDEKAIRREVDRLHPSALIVDETVPVSQLAFPLEGWRLPAGMRVLVVHGQTNRLQIYDQQQLELRSGADLVNVLQA